MRILQLCPLWFPITREAPGGIETFLAALINALEKIGCHSTLLATGNSVTGSELIAVVPVGISGEMAAGRLFEYVYYEQHQVRLALHRQEFDLIHSHIGPGAYILSAIASNRVLHTLHTPIYSDSTWFARQHPDVWFSTVSKFQARKLDRTSRCEAIHNGIEVSSFTFSGEPGHGLFFLGRIEASKGPDLAIEAAQALRLPLTIAGPIVKRQFFEEKIKPRLGGEVRYVGVLDHRQKNELFARSACAVLPFRNEEACPLVLLEAMACGTPVASLPNGAAPEIVEFGVTGYLAENEHELPAMIRKSMDLDRGLIRQRAETRFDITAVAKTYSRLYQRIIADRD